MNNKRARVNRYDKSGRNAKAIAISEAKAQKSKQVRRGCGCGGRR